MLAEASLAIARPSQPCPMQEGAVCQGGEWRWFGSSTPGMQQRSLHAVRAIHVLTPHRVWETLNPKTSTTPHSRPCSELPNSHLLNPLAHTHDCFQDRAATVGPGCEQGQLGYAVPQQGPGGRGTHRPTAAGKSLHLYFKEKSQSSCIYCFSIASTYCFQVQASHRRLWGQL